jgi:hypothetical protein
MELKFKSLVLILVLVACSFTLWLVESLLKYAFYLFEVALILILFCSLLGKTIKIKFNARVNMNTILDYVFLAISMVLLISNILKLNSFLTLVCAIIVSFFLPGYALLRLLKFNSLESWIEWLVLSFALSIGITSIIFTAMLQFATPNPVLLSAVYVGISLYSLLKDQIYKYGEKRKTNSENSLKEYDFAEVLLLLWIIVFFVFAISSLYPQMSLRVGADIVNLFSSSRLLILAPEAYSSVYPWFHATWASVYELSNPPMVVFQTGLAYLSVMVVFSFYVMAKIYLKDIDRRAPIFATVFFSVFAGFGWLCFLKEKLTTISSNTQLRMLSISYDASYADVGYGQGSWLWFWFRPMTLAFTLFFILLYLLGRKDISKKQFIIIFSFITVTLGLIHSPELILFNVFFLVLVLFISSSLLRLKECSFSILIGSIIYASYALVSSMFGGIFMAPSTYVLLILVGAAITSCILTNKPILQRSINLLSSLVMRAVKVLVLIIALVFMAGLSTWFSSPKSFSISYVYETYYIPLMLYPVMLGIIGFFALHGITVISKKHRSNVVVLCVFLFLFTLVYGKIISLINAGFTDLGYGEKRFLPALFASCSMMASVSFLELSKFLHGKKFLLASVITLMVITGMTSTNLSIEYWDRPGSVSYYALDGIEYLSSPLNRDIRTPILTVSSTTRLLAEYIPSPYIINAYRYPLWESRSPEAVALILYNKYYLPPYLFLTYQDFDYMLSRYANGYFTKHMFQLLLKAYENPEIAAYKIPQGTPPSLNSATLLVIPNEDSADYLYAYDMLSLAQCEYTTCLISDIKTIVSGKNIILPRDDEAYLNLLEKLESQVDFQKEGKEVIILNLNGLGPLANLFFKMESSHEVSVTKIKTVNLTLNLPIEIDVPYIVEKENVSVLAWYSNEEKKVPFAAERIRGNQRLIYINVYPLIIAGSKEEFYADPRYVLYLLMSELKDGSVIDLSLNGNDGLVFGAKAVYSSFGRCLDFDGNGSFIEVLHSDTLNPIDEITIEAWVQPRTPDKGFMIVSKKATYGSLDGYMFLFDGGSFYFNFGNGTNFFPNQLSYGRLKSGRWYHLVVTYDGHYINYYVNGEKAGSVKRSEKIAPNNLNLLIGKRHDGAWRLDGIIYKVVIYNKALTQPEIKGSYDQMLNKTLLRSNPISSTLGSLIQIAGVKLPIHVNYETWIFEGNTAFFRSASLKGNIVIKSSSFSEITINDTVDVVIYTGQGQINVAYVEKLYIDKMDYGEIYTNETVLCDGKAFYTRLTLVNPTLSLHGNASIRLMTKDKEVVEMTFQNGQLRIIGQLNALVRTPSIYVNGNAKFDEMYSLFSLYNWLRSLGQDLNIEGEIDFQLTVSDAYIFVINFKGNGLVLRDPPILPWSEYDSIKNMLPWLIVSAICNLLADFIQKRKLV